MGYFPRAQDSGLNKFLWWPDGRAPKSGMGGCPCECCKAKTDFEKTDAAVVKNCLPRGVGGVQIRAKTLKTCSALGLVVLRASRLLSLSSQGRQIDNNAGWMYAADEADYERGALEAMGAESAVEHPGPAHAWNC